MSWKVHTSIQKLRAIDIDRTHNNKLSLKSEEIVTFWWGIFLTFSLGKVLCTYVKSYSVLVRSNLQKYPTKMYAEKKTEF